MPLHQIEIFTIVLIMLALFLWERLRYDVVSSLALLAAVATGCLPAQKAFAGFSNPVVIIIAAVLVVSRGIQVSGVFEAGLRRVLRAMTSPDAQVGVLTLAVTFLSAAMKNVGALGLFIPLALQTASRAKRSPSLYLMPLSFGSLIGGTITLIGTSPNLLISTVRTDLGGKPFSMFDFAPVGFPLACAAVAFLTFGWRLLPSDRSGQRTGEQLFDLENYTTELHVPAGSPLVGKRVRDLEEYGDGELGVVAIVRGPDGGRLVPTPEWRIQAEDLLTVRTDAVTAKKVADAQGLEFAAAQKTKRADGKADDLESVEAIVMPGSTLVGKSARIIRLRRNYETSLMAVSRAGRLITSRLHDHVFAPGDVVVFQGWTRSLPEAMSQLGCLPLADRGLHLARNGTRWIALIILGAALALVLSGLVPVEIAFFAAAVAMVLFKQVTAKEAYDAIEWPIIVMLGALIPIGEAIKETGGAATVAHALAHVAQHTPHEVALGLVVIAAMLLAPLLHHAAAVLVLGPIAAAIAQQLGLHADPFLMAVALGASCDFLTPIGHQNNLLVMGPGGYRFGDYWRLGLPLSLLVVFAGTPLILWFWPLQ